MLQTIRESAKGWLSWFIIIAICIPFALWGIQEYMQPSRTTAVASVNGVELATQEYQQAVRQQQAQIRNMLRNNSADLSFMDEQIRRDALKQMIDRELLIQTAEAHGLRVGDAHLAAQIQSYPFFHDEESKTFSQKRYEELLSSQGMTTAGFESQMRRDMTVEQLQNGILKTHFAPETQQKANQQLQNQQRSVSYVVVPASRFEKEMQLNDAEIEKYYQAHLKEYMTEEKVSVEYVELAKQQVAAQEKIDDATLKQAYQDHLAQFTAPAEYNLRHILFEVAATATPEQKADAKKKAEEVLARLKQGEKFEALAKEFSSDTGTKEEGGSLGWVQLNKGQFVKPFEDAALKLNKDEISEPVETQFGYHLIRLDDKKNEVIKPFEEVKETLTADLQKEQAEQAFTALLDQFSNLAFENPNSLDTLAESMKLTKKSTAVFDRLGIKDDPVVSTPAAVKAAFSDNVLKNRYNSEVIELPSGNVAVLRVLNYEAAKEKPLAEVKAEVETALKQQKSKEQAKQLATQLFDKLKNQADPNAILQESALEWQPVRWIKRTERKTVLAELVQEAFKLPIPAENQATYKLVELNNGDTAILTLVAVKTEDEAIDNAGQQRIQTAIGQAEFESFVSALKNHAEIKTFEQNLNL